MSATEPLCNLMGINLIALSKVEIHFLEAELFTRICDELKTVFKNRYRDYFRLMKFTAEMENAMLESNFIRMVVNDIISTEEYTLQGIARYTDAPEDVLLEIISGQNTCPSAMFVRRVIELHRTVRHDLYYAMTKKIASEYLATPQNKEPSTTQLNNS